MLDGIKQLHRYPGVPRWWDFSRRKHNGMSNPAEMRAFNTLFNDSVLYSIKYTFNTRLRGQPVPLKWPSCQFHKNSDTSLGFFAVV